MLIIKIIAVRVIECLLSLYHCGQSSLNFHIILWGRTPIQHQMVKLRHRAWFVCDQELVCTNREMAIVHVRLSLLADFSVFSFHSSPSSSSLKTVWNSFSTEQSFQRLTGWQHTQEEGWLSGRQQRQGSWCPHCVRRVVKRRCRKSSLFPQDHVFMPYLNS